MRILKDRQLRDYIESHDLKNADLHGILFKGWFPENVEGANLKRVTVIDANPHMFAGCTFDRADVTGIEITTWSKEEEMYSPEKERFVRTILDPNPASFKSTKGLNRVNIQINGGRCFRLAQVIRANTR